MQVPFPFESLLIFGWMSIVLLAGVVLRARIPLLQKFLFPSCLVGGIIGLIFQGTGLLNLNTKDIETFAFHFFNISFISVGLTPGNADGGAKKTKGVLRGPLWMALVEGVTLPLQAVIGGVCVILFGLAGQDLFPTFGFLAPLGFTEGPGQALSIGKVWEGFGFAHAATIGLTFAAMGFFFAFFVGVPLVNWGLRKGLAVHGVCELPRSLLVGIVPKEQTKEPAGSLTMHSGNVDTLAFQAALIGLVYVLTYGVVMGLAGILPPDAGKIIWGFFFFFGMGFGLLIKWIMGRIGIGHLIDPGVQRRITGWSVDYLIIATVMAIQVVVVRQYILPIAVMSVLSGVLTTLSIVYLGNRLDSCNLERTVAIYGTCTGTVSSGLLLLRIVDPEFKTPVAFEIGVMNVIVVPIIVGCMVLVNAPVWWHWSVAMTSGAFAVLGLLCLGLIRVFKLWGAPKV